MTETDLPWWAGERRMLLLEEEFMKTQRQVQQLKSWVLMLIVLGNLSNVITTMLVAHQLWHLRP